MGAGSGGAPTNPLVLGVDDDSLPIRRVVFIVASHGVNVGGQRFVRGSLVDSMLGNDEIRLV